VPAAKTVQNDPPGRPPREWTDRGENTLRNSIRAAIVAVTVGLLTLPTVALAQKAGGTMHIYLWENPSSL
jgi:hypothetical protein